METIRVMPWGSGQGDFVVINKEDFNPEIHKEYSAQKPVEQKPQNNQNQKNNRHK